MPVTGIYHLEEHATGNKTEAKQKVLSCFILSFDCWVNFTNYILQCLEELGMEAKTSLPSWRSALLIEWGIM